MKDGVAARDALLLTTVMAQAGLVEWEACPAAYYNALENGDEELEPTELVHLLTVVKVHGLAVAEMRGGVPRSARACAKKGRIAFVWMQPDNRFGARWWGLLHVCEGNALRIACYPPPDLGHARCYSLAKPSTGQAVITDCLFVPEEDAPARKSKEL